MNKKIIGAILCIGLLTMSAIPVISAAEPEAIVRLSRDPLKYTERLLKRVNVSESEVTYGLCTFGAKRSAEIELLDGNETEIGKVEKILNRGLIRSWLSLPARILVNDLDFTIEYGKDVKNFSRFAYFTVYGEANFEECEFTNLTDASVVEEINTAHKLTVKNFTGYFVSLTSRLFRILPIFQKHRLFTPAEVMFVGFCDEVLMVS